MPNENGRLNIEQKRSKFAFDHKANSKSTNYDAMVKKVPAYIQTNGLVYTLAFLEKKDEGVFDTIWRWHCQTTENTMQLPTLKGKSKKVFLETLLTLSDEDIRLLTLETLALFTWLRRFVDDEKATD